MKREKDPTHRISLTPEAFVKLWTKCATLDAFVDESGMTRQAAQVRAGYYRRKGVPMKSYPRSRTAGRPTLNVKELTKIAKG